MYASKNLTPYFIFRFAWKPLLIFFLYAGLVTFLYEVVGLLFLAVPFVPIGLLGTAVAFYVGFKNNSSYERLWEARRIWGAIVNLSRSFAVYVLDYLKPADGLGKEEVDKHQRIIIHRHLAFINALRIQLRYRRVWAVRADTFRNVVEEETTFINHNLLEEIQRFLHTDEAGSLNKKKHRHAPATQTKRAPDLSFRTRMRWRLSLC